MDYTDDMTVEAAAKAMKAKESRKVKKPKKKTEKTEKTGWKAKIVDAVVDLIPGGKKIESAMEERTGSKSTRKKVYPTRKNQ